MGEGSHEHTTGHIAKITDVVPGPAIDVVYRLPRRPERTTAKEVEYHKDDIQHYLCAYYLP
jgi:hypothetical protein